MKDNFLWFLGFFVYIVKLDCRLVFIFFEQFDRERFDLDNMKLKLLYMRIIFMSDFCSKFGY